MCKKHKEGNFITINLTPHLSQLVKYWLFYGTSKVQNTHFHCCSKSFKVFDHIDSFTNELSIYSVGFEPLISSCADPSYLIQIFYPLIWFTKVRKWSGGFVTPKNVQFEDVSFFIKASDEGKFLLFQRGEIKGK